MTMTNSKDLTSYEKFYDKGLKNFEACELGQTEKQKALNSSFDTCDFTEIKRIRLDSAETVTLLLFQNDNNHL